jgi:hypothetical protein
MEINRKNFSKMMQDNDTVFLAHLEGILSSVDELCSVEITKLPSNFKIRIAPSAPKYTNMIIEELIKFHNRFGIQMDMGKSIKTSAVITFNIKSE